MISRTWLLPSSRCGFSSFSLFRILLLIQVICDCMSLGSWNSCAMFAQAQIVSNATLPFISDQLETFFDSLGVPFYTILAVTAMVVGLFLAFLGAKGQGPKLLAFIAGFLVGCFAAAVVLELIDQQEELTVEVWVGIFFGSGVLLGLVVSCILFVAKIVVGIAVGLTVMGLLLQLGLGELIGSNEAVLAIVVVSVIVGIAVSCWLVDLIFAILSAVLGGAMIILGVGYFTESPLTLNAIVSDPSIVESCTEASCLIPFGIGGVVMLIALVYNIIGFKKKQKQKKKKKQAKEENDDLVNDMQRERKKFEEKFDELERKNKQLALDMEKDAKQREQSYADNVNKQLLKKEEEHAKQLKLIQTKMEKQTRESVKRDKKKEAEHAKQLKKIETHIATQSAVATRLEDDRKDLPGLQLQAGDEKAIQAEVGAGAMIQDSEEEKERKRLEAEKDEARRAQVSEFLLELTQHQLKVQDFEDQFKEAALLEKELTIKLPKVLQPRRFNWLDDDDTRTRETEEITEMRERAEEFSKFKTLVKRTKTAQRAALKNVKKALKDVEKAGSSMRTYSLKNVNNPNQETVRKEKEYALEDLTLKITVLRTLIEKYDANSVVFGELLKALEDKVHEFKAVEKKIQAYGNLSEGNLKRVPLADQVSSKNGKEEYEKVGEMQTAKAAAMPSSSTSKQAAAESLVAKSVIVVNPDASTANGPDIEAVPEVEPVLMASGESLAVVSRRFYQKVDIEPLDSNLEDQQGAIHKPTKLDDLAGGPAPETEYQEPAPRQPLVYRSQYFEGSETSRLSHGDLNEALIQYIKHKFRKFRNRLRGERVTRRIASSPTRAPGPELEGQLAAASDGAQKPPQESEPRDETHEATPDLSL